MIDPGADGCSPPHERMKIGYRNTYVGHLFLTKEQAQLRSSSTTLPVDHMPDVLLLYSIGLLALGVPLFWALTQVRYNSKCDAHPVLLLSSTFHSRFLPVLHSFRYPVLYIGVDLSLISNDAGFVNTFVSTTEKIWRPLSLHREDYLGNKYSGTILEKLHSHMKDHGIDTTSLQKALLVTTPRVFGYSFNPVSFYYVYDKQDHLRVVVLEVNNTFGEKHIYVLREFDNGEQVRQGYTSAHTFPRRFHVSPFNDRSGSYQLQCLDPICEHRWNKVDMHLTLLEADGTKKLTAQVNSVQSPISTENSFAVLWAMIRYGSAVFLTFPRILYQAYVIHYSKKLAVYLRPEPHEDLSAIGRQIAGSCDTYFMSIWLDYLRTNQEWIPCKIVKFDILPATTVDRYIEVEGSGEGELLITVLSYQFFSSLATSESPLCCLWTDSISLASPLFRVSDSILFLQVFASGFNRQLPGRYYLQRPRSLFRGSPDWFKNDLAIVAPEQTEHLHQTNIGLDNHMFDMLLKGSQSLLKYRFKVIKTLWLAWFGNFVFGEIATFAGEAGRPADEWPRVKLEFDKRGNTMSVSST